MLRKILIQISIANRVLNTKKWLLWNQIYKLLQWELYLFDERHGDNRTPGTSPRSPASIVLRAAIHRLRIQVEYLSFHRMNWRDRVAIFLEKMSFIHCEVWEWIQGIGGRCFYWNGIHSWGFFKLGISFCSIWSNKGICGIWKWDVKKYTLYCILLAIWVFFLKIFKIQKSFVSFYK